MKITMDDETARRLADMLEGVQVGPLSDLRMKILRVMEPEQFGAMLNADELAAVVDVLEVATRGAIGQDDDVVRRNGLVKRQALPKLRTMLAREVRGELQRRGALADR